MKAYLDYAATTPVDPRVVKAMQPYWNKKFGNPMSLHSWGRQAKQALEIAREQVADLIGANIREIVFTGSASESNNLALKGIAEAQVNKGKHILISQIEHACIANSAKWLKQQGFEIETLPVDKYGLVKPQELKKRLRSTTILVSILHASNEIGSLQPLKELAAIVKNHQAYFHTDASQSLGKLPISVHEWNIDLLTGSAHKLYGPKGVALLYIKEGLKIAPLIHGGGQESGRRSATHNVPGIVGFGQACKLCQQEMAAEAKRLSQWRDKIIKTVLTTIPHSRLNGHLTQRLPNNVNFSFELIEGESILFALDDQGIGVSTGSACSSAKLEPSQTLLAIGLTPAQAHGSVRISLGRWTTQAEVNHLLKTLPQVITKLRRVSPFKG